MSEVAQKKRLQRKTQVAARPAAKRRVHRKPGYLQAKLAVSQPSDPQEREADAVAERVVQRANLLPGEEQTLNRQPLEEEEEMLQPSLFRQAEEEEEEAIQTQLFRQVEEEEEESLQTKLWRQEEEEEVAQPKLFRQEEEEEVAQPKLLRKAEADHAQASDALQQAIEQQIGLGDPLPEEVRQQMQNRLGHNLENVRIHTDGTADSLCKQINARAFTYGSDIFFAAGQFAPTSQAGQRLLAHELTHVLQQRQRVQRMLMREGEAPAPATGSSTLRVSRGEYAGSTIDPAGKRIEISKISLPDFKGRRHRGKFTSPITLRRGGRGQTQQIANWRSAVRTQVQQQLGRLAQQARQRGGMNESGQVFFQGRGQADLLLFGTEEQLQPRFEIPIWDRNKQGRSFQVDHIVEDQLGGGDDTSNYELLDASANMSAGSKIAHQIRQRIQGALRALRTENGSNVIPPPSRWRYVKNNYSVIFRNHDFALSGFAGNPHQHWQLNEIQQGRATRLLRPLRQRELARLGREGQLIFFASAQGGERLPRPRRTPTRNWLPRVDYLGWTPSEADGEAAGTLRVDVFKAASGRRRDRGVSVAPDYPPQNWQVRKVDGIHGGTVDPQSVARGVQQSLRLPGMSPVQLDTVSLGANGIHGEGRVLPSVPLIGDADIRLRVDGDEVQLRKTFDTGEIAIPAPFSISDSSLTVFYGSRSGLGIEGRADFGIERVGEGHVEAAASTEGGFALEGAFDFDSRLFDPAGIQVAYRDNQFSASGEIGIPEGKIRGIKSAQITASYQQDGNRFSASGQAELDVPGVERGTLNVSYSEADGLAIGGGFDLSSSTPGIRSGHIEAQLTERPDGSGYALAASGTAQPDIPGFDSELSVSYDDGALTAEASARYQRGMLDGQIRVGASNRALDESGNPTGEATDQLRLYGGGQVTLGIAPWLEASAGIELLPNGEIEVRGEIGLPDNIEIFPRKEINKRLFGIDIPIPIVPGVMAEIGGSLSAHAGIGAGVIDELRLGIEYNPAHEENTHVTGSAHLNIPADAGLRLAVRAGIGLGIPAASVTGGLEIGGELGLQGAAEAGVQIDWMPSRGLEINAFGRLSAQPRFVFDISGYVEVEALWVTVYEKRWQFASFEYGSDLTFGIRFPIHYIEGQPFDISLDDVEFEVPDVSPRQILSDLIDRIA